ncbi:WSC-domain-containing protein [Macrolepiota fuliginosa MF-IS2]|uniref:WSC-domain-containing protein n=1 Tax=Macrolepiota fuliginosa MF-IS2 TaxID=1400762 RepID=A0A9P6C486_9AGAR|nr:WSC-domain-containing protein [Macrolepiota fuliginosa MF-IS2]
MRWSGITGIALATVLKVSAQLTVASYKDWLYLGCFGDNPVVRNLHHFVGGFPFLTVQDCLDQCDNLGFGFAGLEYNHECFCGNALLYNAEYGPSQNCYTACSGDSTQICGGPNALSTYQNGKVPFTVGPAQILPRYKNWVFTQCWQDDIWPTGGRRLLPKWPNTPIPPEEMTVERCIDGCEASGYTSAGMEYGQECWCGNVTYPPGQSTSSYECNMPCLMNAGQICGGSNRIVVYTTILS